ncbi:MAG: 16S rRNA processing protein RimM [Ruminiclostridium sp.]|nr:16S rRNA processing protein RimM [Ruminiclostridium sp.]
MRKQYLEMGKITKTQGLKGEVRMQYYCDSPDELEEFNVLYMGKEKTEVELEKSRYLKSDVAVIKIKGIDTPEAAQKLIGKMLYINRDDVELPEDVWFIQDIIGLEVIDADDGTVYGKVDEIYQNGSADVYSIKTPDGKNLMFPAIPEVLISTDIDEGKITIRPLEGLFDIYRGKGENGDED